MAWTYRRPLGATRYRGVLAALLVWFVFVTAAWTPLNEALYLSAAESMENRLSVGVRALNSLDYVKAAENMERLR